MNDIMQQDTFNELAAQHALWLQTDGEDGRRAHFRGADLSQVFFNQADLSGANMRGTILAGCDLRGVSLDDADLAESDLHYANLTGANCHRTNFSRANLESAYLNQASCFEAIFQQANCKNLDARNAQMTSVNLREADLAHANFSFSQLSGALMRSAKAVDTIFSHSDLSHADCNDVKFYGTTFIETILSDTNMRKAEFIDVSFGDSDFSDCSNLDPSLFTQSASQTKQSLQSELETLQALRNKIEKERKELEDDQEATVKARLRLQSLWKEEAKFNEMLSRRNNWLQNAAMACGAIFTALLILAGYQGALVEFAKLYETQGTLIIALWLGFAVICLIAGVQLYRLCSATVRHLQDKASLLSGTEADMASEHLKDTMSQEEKAASTTHLLLDAPTHKEGKIEYF